jgi:hypothetical protein
VITILIISRIVHNPFFGFGPDFIDYRTNQVYDEQSKNDPINMHADIPYQYGQKPAKRTVYQHRKKLTGEEESSVARKIAPNRDMPEKR